MGIFHEAHISKEIVYDVFLCYDDLDQNDFFQFFPFVSEFKSFLKCFFFLTAE